MQLRQSDEITVVVTDSGLGGLSVAADFAARVIEKGFFRKARIVFFNCRPGRKYCFDAIKTLQEKTSVFMRILKCINREFNPDAVLVACNTLSVLYEEDIFEGTPVVGVVKAGTDMIAEHLHKQPEAVVLMLGVDTIVMSGAHKRILVESGFCPDNLIYQACNGLAQAIENGPDSETTLELLRGFVRQAVDKIPDKSKPVVLSLNCTHYGYISDLFKKVFREYGVEPAAVLDPNIRMNDYFFDGMVYKGFTDPEIVFEVVSQIEMSNREKNALVPMLEPVSPHAARALQNASYRPGLFPIAANQKN